MVVAEGRRQEEEGCLGGGFCIPRDTLEGGMGWDPPLDPEASNLGKRARRKPHMGEAETINQSINQKAKRSVCDL